MNMKPVRRIRPTRGRNYRSKITGKSLRMIYAESLLERDYVKLCNFDPAVAEIGFQPVGIKYYYKGRKRKFFPDYLIRTYEGHYIIAEVKLNKYVDTDLNKAKFLAAEHFCREREWLFQVVTEQQIRPGKLQRNINLLLEVKPHPFVPSIAEYIRAILNVYGPMSIVDLIFAFAFFFHLCNVASERPVSLAIVLTASF